MTYPIIIIGGGLAGLATALMLAKQNISSLILDQSKSKKRDTIRTTTLNPFAKEQLEFLGVIDWLKKNHRPLSPIREIKVSDTNTDSDLLGWESEDKKPLAYVIRNSDLIDALTELVKKSALITYKGGVTITDFAPATTHASLTDKKGKIWEAGLVLACDGSRSAMRKMAKIKTFTRDLKQVAITADIELARPHHNTAWQRFLKSGPLALMPLDKKNLASLVWSIKQQDSAKLLNADKAGFNKHLNQVAKSPFGELSLASKTQHFPITLSYAMRPIGERIALIGDAAHSIHPLAGQGFNLALGDIAALGDSFNWAARNGCEAGDPLTLGRYANSRISETLALTLATDGLNWLFSDAPEPIANLASAGMAILDRSPLKNIATHIASGNLNHRG